MSYRPKKWDIVIVRKYNWDRRSAWFLKKSLWMYSHKKESEMLLMYKNEYVLWNKYRVMCTWKTIILEDIITKKTQSCHKTDIQLYKEKR